MAKLSAQLAVVSVASRTTWTNKEDLRFKTIVGMGSRPVKCKWKLTNLTPTSIYFRSNLITPTNKPDLGIIFEGDLSLTKLKFRWSSPSSLPYLLRPPWLLQYTLLQPSIFRFYPLLESIKQPGLCSLPLVHRHHQIVSILWALGCHPIDKTHT